MRVWGRQAGTRVRNSHVAVKTSRPLAGAPLALLVSALLVAACDAGGASPTPPPPPAATPTPTPDPHLAAPASVDEVFAKLSAAGLRIVGNNADQGSEPLERLNTTYAGWPLILSEYSTAAAARKAVAVGLPAASPVTSAQPTTTPRPSKGTKTPKPTKAPTPGPSPRPGADDAPFTFVGLNIVAEFGPHLRRADDPLPEQRFIDAATALAAALDPLLGPLSIRAVVPVEFAGQ
jgi:hypothetical protein